MFTNIIHFGLYCNSKTDKDIKQKIWRFVLKDDDSHRKQEKIKKGIPDKKINLQVPLFRNRDFLGFQSPKIIK